MYHDNYCLQVYHGLFLQAGDLSSYISCYPLFFQTDVPQITDDQPRNYYNTIHILSAHTDVIDMLVKIDNHRYIFCQVCRFWYVLSGINLWKVVMGDQ